MNILIVSQYFWPESFIINDLVLAIKAEGHHVTVFTGKPNYPQGVIYPGFSQTGIQEELYDETIKVFRVPLRPRKNGSGKNLALNYFSFIFSGLKHAFSFSKKKRFDAILAFAPSPITSVLPAILLKWLTKAHLATWVQDLWPESIEATGFIHNLFLLGCTKQLVKGIYRFSDSILVQSKAFIPPVSKLASKKKIIYYPNSVLDNFGQSELPSPLPNELADILNNHFCFVFAGNLGTAQAVEILVDAAELTKTLPDCKILLVGSGSMSDWILQQKTQRKLNNLILAGRFPASVMPHIYSKARALIVTLKSNEIFTYTIPSKIQAYLAVGKPILAAINGEGARVINEAGAGFTSAAQDAIALSKNIEYVYQMPESERNKLGELGRAYFLKHFEMKRQSQRLIEILEKSIGPKGNK